MKLIEEPNKSNQSKKLSKVLLEIAEMDLKSPETSHFISEEGVERVRQKLV